MLDALTAEARIDHQARELELPAHLTEMVAPPALGRVGRGLGLWVKGGILDRLADVGIPVVHDGPRFCHPARLQVGLRRDLLVSVRSDSRLRGAMRVVARCVEGSR